MASEAPPFWWDKPDWRAWALYPASAIYGAFAARGLKRGRREKVDLPVLCIGNFTVGGAGKTPVAIALANELIRRGHRPGFLSRGYGGSLTGTHLVDPENDSARLTGDEPLLLARQAPVVVSASRAAGARILAEQGCDFIIMDDGFQSARLHYDYALLVVDAVRGLGNGHVIPGGPVRAPLVDQLRHASAVMKLGEGNGADRAIRMAARAARPVFQAAAIPLSGSGIEGWKLLAFAGIGDPQKFFKTAAAIGGEVVQTRSYPDHHLFSDEELGELIDLANGQGLELVTTAKDAVRLRHGTERAREFLQKLHVLEIEVRFEDDTIADRIIQETFDAFHDRTT